MKESATTDQERVDRDLVEGIKQSCQVSGARATTQAMEEKDEVWASECRPTSVRALQVHVAARDSDVAMPRGESA